ncbi:glycosyltransferase [Methyloferula stellata]|uniref:glycosyltransferase n=1 Tax=Methyloferula stellata TaxID=876270 RepID=UPI00035F6F92|nr:glycosyltransferase [Methyloferula stellata]
MKLAIISTYGEVCGIASYARAIEKTFKHRFDVTVFDLKTAALIANEKLNETAAAEEHIDQICHMLANYDCVNIQMEWDLFGRSIEAIERRVLKLCQASKCLIITLHSLHLFVRPKPWQDMHHRVFESLKKRSTKQPYWIITHLPREAELMRSVFAIENVTDFPVVYLSNEEVATYRQLDKTAWKKDLGFQEDDIVILRAGYLMPHKDQMVSIKSLGLLPQQYKLAFAGGEYPPIIQTNEVSALVKEATEYLDNYDEAALKARQHYGAEARTLGDRIRFLGNISDSELYTALACTDFVTITHLESGQGASGIASIALQLEQQVILSYNRLFLEYNKYYRGGFSFFTMGNHYELRDKILNFKPATKALLGDYGKKYSLDKLAELFRSIYQNMLDGKFNNAGQSITIDRREVTAEPNVRPRTGQMSSFIRKHFTNNS